MKGGFSTFQNLPFLLFFTFTISFSIPIPGSVDPVEDPFQSADGPIDVGKDILDGAGEKVKDLSEIPGAIWDFFAGKIKEGINRFFGGINSALEKIDRGIDSYIENIVTSEFGMTVYTVQMVLTCILFCAFILLIRVYILVLDLIPVL